MNTRLLIAIILIVLGGIGGNVLRYTEVAPDRPADFGLIPNAYNGYVGTEQFFSDATYDVLKADLTTFRDFTGSDGSRVGLFAAYFSSQKYGSQIHSPKHCLPGGGWRIDDIHPYQLHLPGGITKEVNRSVISNRNSGAVMLYWFETRSGAIRSEYGLKLDLVKNSLLFRPTDAAIIRLTVNAPGGNVDLATRQAESFLQAFYPSIQNALPF
ncbi:MAG: EpsI family protein [candidate division Zixibacteria bacterium]|nr:EpsI family protein [candidate division Zixibacteria bacterium]